MLEKHHIIFRSQGGLNFPLNYKYLTAEQHRGNNSPHMSREIDLQYKVELEQELRHTLTDTHYSIDELIQILELEKKQAYKGFKQVSKGSKGMEKEDVIFRLLGGRFYL